MEAIILCGGLGTRIRTVTKDSYPKAMITVQGKTIIEWELEWLRKNGVKHAILAVRHLAAYIEDQFGKVYSTNYGDIEVTYSEEKEKLGSGGAVYLARKFISEKDTLILNGDIMTNFNLDSMIEYHKKNSKTGTIAVVKLKSPFGIVEMNEEDLIHEFMEKPTLDHWIHAGVDIFDSSILSEFPERGQMEETIFVKLAEEGKLKAFRVDPSYYWRSIDNPKDLQETEREWQGID